MDSLELGRGNVVREELFVSVLVQQVVDSIDDLDAFAKVVTFLHGDAEEDRIIWVLPLELGHLLYAVDDLAQNPGVGADVSRRVEDREEMSVRRQARF